MYHVNDSAANNLAPDDIKDEGVFTANASTINSANNYEYDEIGNLKHDSQEQIDSITWTVYGKIKKIIRTDTSSKPDLEFNYDASGNRISKIVKPHGTSIDNGGTDIPTQWTTTYYVRDGQGNIMTTYKLAAPASATSFKVIERNMFGNSRLGTDDSQIELIAALPTANPYTRTLGNKHYEASNHLGNVLTVFTDRKIPVTSNGTTIDHFDADVVNTFDYSPFGAPMNERTYRMVMKYTDGTHTTSLPAFVNGNEPLDNIAKDSLSYRYTFNGKEKDDEISGSGNEYNFGARIYNPRLGKWFSVDPLASSYVPIAPYTFALDNPLRFIDIDGRKIYDGQKEVIVTIDSKTNTASYAHADGTPVSQHFMEHGAKIINAMIKTPTGTKAVVHMTTIPTKIELTLTNKPIIGEDGKETHGETLGKGEVTDGKTEDIYYKSATVKVTTAEIEENPNDRYNGFSNEEKINGSGTHEDKHLDPEQIIEDTKGNKGEIDKQTAEQGPVKQEYESRKEYRAQYGKEGDRDINPNYNKYIKKDEGKGATKPSEGGGAAKSPSGGAPSGTKSPSGE